jgi:hypothetical protein
MSEPLATIINKERDRLTKGLADLQAKQNELYQRPDELTRLGIPKSGKV